MAKLNGGGVTGVAITDTFVVNSQAAMLALTAQVGDVAVRTDTSKTYILQTEPASTLGNWVEMLQPVTTISAGTGISVGGAAPAWTVTNSAPDQVVALTPSTGIGITGTYPSFTITNSAPDQTVALSNGAGISVTGTYPNFTIASTITQGITGTGADTRIPVFNGAGTVTSYADLIWDETNHRFVAGTGTIAGTYNQMFGYLNTISGSGDGNFVAGEQLVATGFWNTVFGNLNTIVTGNNNFVAGTSNSVTTPAPTGNVAGNAIFGQSNTVTSMKNAVFGSSNSVGGDGYNLVGGKSNTIGTSEGYNAIWGDTHTLTSVGFSAVMGRGLTVTGNYNAVFGQGNTAGGIGNLIGGQTNNGASGTYNVIGGYNHTVSKSYNAVFGKHNTVTTNDYAMVAGFDNTVGYVATAFGDTNVASGTESFAVGYANTASGFQSAAIGGQNASIGNRSVAINWACATTGDWSFAQGENSVTAAGAKASSAFGRYSSANMPAQMALAGYYDGGGGGRHQTSTIPLFVATTDATATEMKLTETPSYMTTADSKAYAFVATVVAKQSGSTNHAMYILKWASVRTGGVGTFTVDGLVKEVIFESDAAWDVDVVADTTNGRPAINVTGVAATNIKWSARVEMTEVLY